MLWTYSAMSHILLENPHSLSYQAEIFPIFLPTTLVKDMGKISAWYDNEWGLKNRMCDIAEHLHQIT